MAVNSSLWKKGTSPNPSGRPKNFVIVREKALGYSEECIDFLISVVRDVSEDKKNRIVAAIHLLDRGMGRPAQAIQIQDPNGESVNPSMMSRVELQAVIESTEQIVKEKRLASDKNKGTTYEG